jgi:hypothetical protein
MNAVPYSLVDATNVAGKPAAPLFRLEKVYVSGSAGIWKQSLKVSYPEYRNLYNLGSETSL